MATPQTLTWEEVQAAARAAYEDGRLTAQAPLREDRECKYRWRDRVCAIGAALSDEVAHLGDRYFFGSGSPVCWLRQRGYIAMPDADFHLATELQQAHDTWCSADDDERAEAEQAFLAALDAEVA